MLMFRTFAQEHPCAQSMILCISNARAYFTHLAVLFQRMDGSIQRIMTHAFYTIMLKKYECWRGYARREVVAGEEVGRG